MYFKVLYVGGATATYGYAYPSAAGSSESASITLSKGTYYLVISPKSDLGNYSFKISLPAPVISEIKNTTSGVKITWDAVTGAEKYRVYRKTESGSWKKVKNTTSTSYTDKNVTNKKKYYYKVCCLDDTNTTEYSDCSAKKSITYLKAGKITSLTNTSSGVKIKWSKVSGASGYRIYRKTSSGNYEKVKTITSGSTTSYTDKETEYENGTTYVYYVQPYSGSTKGGYKTAKTVRLATPLLYTLNNTSSKAATVTWLSMSYGRSNVKGYQIQYSTSSSFAKGNKTVTVSGGARETKKLSKLTKGKKYYVRVRSYTKKSNTKYYSAWSSKKSVKITK